MPGASVGDVRAAILLAACAAPLSPQALPALVVPEPPDLIDANTYTARVATLRATLQRSQIELDAKPVEPVCTVHHGIDDCMRCEVAGRLDTSGIDPDLIDAVAIAFARYAPKVLAASQLQHVTLCRSIRYDHEHGGPDPAGVAVFEDRRLFVSIEFFHTRERTADFTIEEVVHHELFHMLDRAAKIDADHAWQALNPPGFVYADPADLAAPRPRGFVDSYSTTNELEDRASTFAYLMAQPDKLCAIVAGDPIVAAKARLVWSRIAPLMRDHQIPAGCLSAAHKPSPRPGKPVLKPAPKYD